MGLIKPNETTSAVPTSQRLKRMSNLRAWTPKLLLGRLCGVLIILIVVALIISYIDNHKKPTATVDTNKDPCAFFTLTDAQKLLGKSAQKGGVPPIARSSSKDTDITTCSYTQPTASISGGPVSTPNTTAVVVGTPKTNLGKNLNDYEFNQYLPTTSAEVVSGYGDKAYWDSTLGVLNVYKNNKWVIISNGSIKSPQNRTLDDAKKLADIVVPLL
jgi:hypothetical protein